MALAYSCQILQTVHYAIKMRPHFCFSSNSALRFLITRATITIVVAVAIAMMRTTATTPPMMAAVLSVLEGGVGIDTLSPSDAGAVHQCYLQSFDML